MGHSGMDRGAASSWCSFVPSSFLSTIVDEPSAKRTIDEGVELLNKVNSSGVRLRRFPGAPRWDVHDAQNRFEYPGHPNVSSPTVTEEEEMDEEISLGWMDGRLWRMRDFFKDQFDYELFGDGESTIPVTTGFGKDYMNAHWTGNGIVLGSGHEHLLSKFEYANDVIVHELTHGIITSTSGLENSGEPGALSEHLADVFAILYKQYLSPTPNVKDCVWVIGETLWNGERLPYWSAADEKSWSISPAHPISVLRKKKNVFDELPRYLRSFADPESTNPAQPIHYGDFMKLRYDNGGVHFNSGIANYAFYTAAIEAGSPPVKGVGQVWFRAMTDPILGADCDFPKFAAFTIAYARRDYPELEKPIEKGWEIVGVKPAAILRFRYE